MSVVKTRMGYSEARIVKASTWLRKLLINVEHGIKILPHFIAQHHQNLIAKAHANLALTIAWRASATLIDDELRCAKGGAGTGNPARVWLGTIGFRGAVAHVQAFGLKAAAQDRKSTRLNSSH